MIVTLRGRRFRGGGGDPPANTLPVVSLVLPVGNQFVAGDLLVRASVSDTDNNIASVKFYLDGIEKYDVPSPNAAGGNFDYTIPSADIPVGGPYEIRVRATDGGGLFDEDAKIFSVVESSGLVNVALASNGAVASASSFYSTVYRPGNAFNGERSGSVWGGTTGSGWNDSTAGVFPDYLVCDFGVVQTISSADVFSLQDNFMSPVEPTPEMTFTLYGLVDFELQYWTGSDWATVPGTSVTGNNLVWRHFDFTPIDTSRVRLAVFSTPDQWSRVTELEVWSPNPNIPPPVVEITSPFGPNVYGAPTIEATVTAYMGGVVNRVTLHRNGDLINSVTGLSTASYNYSFVDSAAPNGLNDYIVTGYDDVQVLERDAQKSVTRLGSTGDTPMFWSERSTLPFVERARSLDAEDEAEFNAGRWGWQNVGLWTPSPGSGPNGFFVTDTGSNPGRELPLPVFDTTNPPPGRTKSLKTTIIEGSPANAGGGAFINSRGGNMYPVGNPDYLANTPNYDDIDLRIHGASLIGTKFAIQVCFRGDDAYCTTNIYQQIPGTIDPSTTNTGWKILDFTRPNYGSNPDGSTTGTSVDNPTTDDYTSCILTGGPNGKRYPVMYNCNDDFLTVGRSHPDFPGLNDENYQPRKPDAETIFPYASYQEGGANPGMATPEARAIPTAARGGIKTTWGCAQVVLTLLSIDSAFPDGFSWNATFNWKWYWQDWGGDEVLCGDMDFQTQVGPHLFAKLNIFPGYLTEKARGQSHPDMNCWASMAIIASDKIPPSAEIKYMIDGTINPNPTYRQAAALETWAELPNSTMQNYRAPYNAVVGNPDFNDTNHEPWNTYGRFPWSNDQDSWGGVQGHNATGRTYVSRRAGHGEDEQSNTVARYHAATNTPFWEHIKASSPYRTMVDPSGSPYEALGDEGAPGSTEYAYADGGPCGAHIGNCGLALDFPEGPKLVWPWAWAQGFLSNIVGGHHFMFDVATRTWSKPHPDFSPTYTGNYDTHKQYPGTRKVFCTFGGSAGSGEPFAPDYIGFFDYDNMAAGRQWLGVNWNGIDPTTCREKDIIIDDTRDRIIICGTTTVGHENDLVVIEHVLTAPAARFQALTGAGASNFTGTQLNSGHFVRWQDKYYVMNSKVGASTCAFTRMTPGPVDDSTPWVAEAMPTPPVTPPNQNESPEKLVWYCDLMEMFIFFPMFAASGYFFKTKEIP
jgi:hypothetical protein